LGTFAKEEEDREPMQISQAISSIASIKDSVMMKTTVPQQQQPEHRPTTGGFQDDFDFDVEQHPTLRQTQLVQPPTPLQDKNKVIVDL